MFSSVVVVVVVVVVVGVSEGVIVTANVEILGEVVVEVVGVDVVGLGVGGVVIDVVMERMVVVVFITVWAELPRATSFNI